MNTLHISTVAPEVISALSVLGSSQPSAEFTITISGGNLAALLAGAAPVVVNVVPTPAKVVAPTPTASEVAEAKRIRRTKEENAAGLTIEEAEAFRAQNVYSDPQSFKASLDDSTPEEAPAPVETASPKGPVQLSAEVTESDLRTAAAAAVAAGHKAEVMKVAADAGVKKWSELDPSKYGAVLTELTSLMVIS